MAKKEGTVTVYPSPTGGHVDGVPHVVQEVSPQEAEMLVATGVFTLEKPRGYSVNEAGELVKREPKAPPEEEEPTGTEPEPVTEEAAPPA